MATCARAQVVTGGSGRPGAVCPGSSQVSATSSRAAAHKSNLIIRISSTVIAHNRRFVSGVSGVSAPTFDPFDYRKEKNRRVMERLEQTLTGPMFLTLFVRNTRQMRYARKREEIFEKTRVTWSVCSAFSFSVVAASRSRTARSFCKRSWRNSSWSSWSSVSNLGNKN